MMLILTLVTSPSCLTAFPGALARAELGRKQAAAGETISLDEL